MSKSADRYGKIDMGSRFAFNVESSHYHHRRCEIDTCGCDMLVCLR